MLAQPIILRYFVSWLLNGQAKQETGLLLAAALWLVSLSLAIDHHALYFFTMRMGWNLRIGMTGAVNWKVLRQTRTTVSNFGPGKVINLISTDVLRYVQD